MADINLTDDRGRDAVVSVESLSSRMEVRYVDGEGTQATNRKILRATMEQSFEALEEKFGGPEEIAEALVEDDLEVDLERMGAYLDETSRVYVNPKKEIVHKITQWEVILDPDGKEKERRPKKLAEPNVAAETPLKWTGKMLKKADVYTRFVFSGTMQIIHVNGLTYDFLYSMAKQLEELDSLMLLAGGAKGNEPLLFRRGGLPYRGFLEGRTRDDKYALILHLSNMELKSPDEPGAGKD